MPELAQMQTFPQVIGGGRAWRVVGPDASVDVLVLWDEEPDRARLFCLACCTGACDHCAAVREQEGDADGH